MTEIEHHHQTEQKDKVSVGQKVGYGMGAMSTNLAVNSLSNMGNLIYNIGLGVSPEMLGIAQGIPRVIDAITDPLIGNMSDNSRSRFGRRRPYIMVGGILMGIIFALLWMVPPHWGDKATLAYFLIMSCLFYIAYTIIEVPRGALGYELTSDYHERTRIFAYCSFLINAGSLCLPWLYFVANLDYFVDEVEGMKYVGMVIGGILIVSAVACALVCKEPKYEQAQVQQRVGFWESVTTTCKNRTFLHLLAIVFVVTIGLYFVMGFANYIMIFYVYSGDQKAASILMGWCGTLWGVLSLIGVFPMTWIATRIGKSKTVMIFLLIMAAGNALKCVCYSREHPWLALIPTAALAFGLLVLFSLVYAMLADICDEDELNTGKRREGSYQAMYGWWWKLGIAAGIFVQGFLLKSTGFDANLAMQAEDTLWWLRFWEITIPSVLCLVSVGLLLKYPLTEQRAYEIKSLLDARRTGQNEAK